MLEIKFIRQILSFAFTAAFVYCVVVFFYIKGMSYNEIFILYVGNFLFAAVIAIFIGWFYKQHESDISTIRLVVVGGKTAFAGIIIALLMILLMLIIFVPSIFKPEAVSHLQLKDSPGQFEGKNGGFAAILFLNAIVGNAAASFFFSLLIPFAVMKNLYGDEKRQKPESVAAKEENPKKNYNL
jgi:hypothetical protein